MTNKQEFLTMPIRFKVKKNQFGITLLPPDQFVNLFQGSKPRRRTK